MARRMRQGIAIALAGILLAAGSGMAFAQSPPGTIALSPEERAAVLETAANRREFDGLPLNGADRQVHGMMGFEIGTRGERAVFGSTTVPLGENGSAAFSFMTGQQGRLRR